MAADREIRRHILRFVNGAAGGQGRELSRVVLQALILYGHAVTWTEFDRHVLYLIRAACLTETPVHPTVSKLRWLTITQHGMDLLEGSVVEPGVMPPDEI